MSRIKTDLDDVRVKLLGATHRSDSFELTLDCREPVRNILLELEGRLSEKIVGLSRGRQTIRLHGRLSVRASGIRDGDEIQYYVQGKAHLHRYFTKTRQGNNAVELAGPAASNQQDTQFFLNGPCEVAGLC